MTADEIRQRANADFAAIAEVEINNERGIVKTLMVWLPEIAAQLAESNNTNGAMINQIFLAHSNTQQVLEEIAAQLAELNARLINAERYQYWREHGVIVSLHSDTGEPEIVRGSDFDKWTDGEIKHADR